MKVYVLTSGEYSNYRINGVTTDKEKAENLCRIFSQWEIEEYDTEALATEILDGLRVYIVKFYRDDVEYAAELDAEYVDGGDLKSAKSKRVYPIYPYKNKNNITGYAVYVYAKDKEHAMKIAQDRLAEWKAEKEGIV